MLIELPIAIVEDVRAPLPTVIWGGPNQGNLPPEPILQGQEALPVEVPLEFH
jgi:hypothetical protein